MEKKEKLIIVIPAYEPPIEFIDYALSVSKNVDQLVVVNDGSSDSYNDVFEKIASFNNTHIISYSENKGKGYALKSAFKYIFENFDENDIVVTADCDGQHSIEDVFKVYKVSKEHTNALVLGSRDFTNKNVPKRSKSGNYQMCFMFRFFYGIRLYDTQTGLRGFRVRMFEKFLKTKGDRFEYELGVLITARKYKIPIIEVPIKTIYPENEKDHVSHFKTVSDSLKVLKVMFGNLNWYILSSVLSAAVDVLLFYFLAYFIFVDKSAINELIATVSARVASSVVNFTFNYKYVFNGCSRKSIIKYYVLWLLQLGASYGIVFVFGNILDLNLLAVKIVGDLTLALISYKIQQNWVFSKKDKDGSFYGPTARLALWVGRRITKKHRCNVIKEEEAAVYVCRNLEMKGPFTTLSWIRFNIHPYVLSVFFNQKECYRQCADYTFSVKVGKKPKKINLKAFFTSIAISRTVKSLKAIPVYRGTVKSISTVKTSLAYLLKGESIIVFPDKDYTKQYGDESDIYDGFLALGQMYKKRCGKELKYVPLVIDTVNRKIEEQEPVIINDFNKEKDVKKEELIRKINKLP